MKFPGDTPFISCAMVTFFGLLSGAALKHNLARYERNQILQKIRTEAKNEVNEANEAKVGTAI